MNLTPRHQQIVGEILGEEYSRVLTVVIGFSEIIMAIWIVSNYRSKINTILQICIVATMNVLEFILVPDLLLWGSMNSLFALMFIYVVWYNEFKLKEQTC